MKQFHSLALVHSGVMFPLCISVPVTWHQVAASGLSCSLCKWWGYRGNMVKDAEMLQERESPWRERETMCPTSGLVTGCEAGHSPGQVAEMLLWFVVIISPTPSLSCILPPICPFPLIYLSERCKAGLHREVANVAPPSYIHPARIRPPASLHYHHTCAVSHLVFPGFFKPSPAVPTSCEGNAFDGYGLWENRI